MLGTQRSDQNFRVSGDTGRPKIISVRRSASIASMSNPISFAEASSSHHSSGGFGIEVSPEPEINAHPLRRNAAENTKPPERTITVRPCGGETRDVRTKRLFISAFVKACPPRTNGQRIMIAKNASSLSQGSSGRDKPNQL